MSSVTADRFARSLKGRVLCAHPDFLLTEAVLIFCI